MAHDLNEPDELTLIGHHIHVPGGEGLAVEHQGPGALVEKGIAIHHEGLGEVLEVEHQRSGPRFFERRECHRGRFSPEEALFAKQLCEGSCQRA
jgi:hypothetical protein